MTRHRRLFLASLLAAWVGMVLACGGTGNNRGGNNQEPPGGPDVISEKPGGMGTAELQAEQEVRQKFEADHKRYEDAKKAHEAEVERVKAENVKQEEQYREATEQYGKDLMAFSAAKAEYEALRKLALARTLFDDSREKRAKGQTKEAERLMESAQNRWQEIVKSFPGSKAASDAKDLFEGKVVDARPIPKQPVPPIPPTEPVALKMPPPPPEEPVYVSAAKQAEQKRAEAERKRRAEAEAEERERAEKVTRANYHKVQDGMSLAEVQAILGPGKESASGPGVFIATWQSKPAILQQPTIISITFENNRVQAKAILP